MLIAGALGNPVDAADVIPAWIKDVAGLWFEGQISDSEYLATIEYLINNNIIKFDDLDNLRKTIETLRETIEYHEQKSTSADTNELKNLRELVKAQEAAMDDLCDSFTSRALCEAIIDIHLFDINKKMQTGTDSSNTNQQSDSSNTNQQSDSFEVKVINCEQSTDRYIGVQGSIKNNLDTTIDLEYLVNVADDNQEILSFTKRTIWDFAPGQTEFIDSSVRWAGDWEYCGIQTTTYTIK